MLPDYSWPMTFSKPGNGGRNSETEEARIVLQLTRIIVTRSGWQNNI